MLVNSFFLIIKFQALRWISEGPSWHSTTVTLSKMITSSSSSELSGTSKAFASEHEDGSSEKMKS